MNSVVYLLRLQIVDGFEVPSLPHPGGGAANLRLLVRLASVPCDVACMLCIRFPRSVLHNLFHVLSSIYFLQIQLSECVD